MTSHLP